MPTVLINTTIVDQMEFFPHYETLEALQILNNHNIISLSS